MDYVLRESDAPRGRDTVQGRTGSDRATPLKAAGWTALVLAFTAAGVVAFLSAWRQIRLTPGLVDGWPCGAFGFGLSCAAAVLAGRAGLVRCLRGTQQRARWPLTAAYTALGLLGLVYGLAVVPPRWCYQSTSPDCASLPGAAEAGLAFLGTLIGAFFAGGAVSAAAGRVRRAHRTEGHTAGRGKGRGAATAVGHAEVDGDGPPRGPERRARRQAPRRPAAQQPQPPSAPSEPSVRHPAS